MEHCLEYQDYFFLTDENYLLKLSEEVSNCLVKVKLFNKRANEEFDRNIYLDFPNATDENQVLNCVNEIISRDFSYIKSWLPEILIKK